MASATSKGSDQPGYPLERTFPPVSTKPGPEVIKLLSCSAQLSIKFIQLINTEIAKINGNFRFKSLKPAIYPADKF